ncbi:MAG: AfsR/SARP family transcriptional regulator [Streptosporangiaceae bacterium]|nr:AfsR/SARP family transcriptional regulator [Streptosporangiaceae bacterium]
MLAAVEYGVLGPFSVRCDGVYVHIPRGKQRALLAALLLSAGRVVSVDDLSWALWGGAPPLSARVTLQNYVKRLRTVLDDAAHHRIGTIPPGYLIRLQPGELDAERFESLLHVGVAAIQTGDWVTGARELRAGLALWRGEPLAGVPSPVLALTEAPRLAELRLQALEARIDADLHLGRNAEVVPELRKLTVEHPLRERLHARLMLALYRDGRQGDALAAYQAVRYTLVSELGAEPCPELRALHQKILAHDAALSVPPPAAPATCGRFCPARRGAREAGAREAGSWRLAGLKPRQGRQDSSHGRVTSGKASGPGVPVQEPAWRVAVNTSFSQSVWSGPHPARTVAAPAAGIAVPEAAVMYPAILRWTPSQSRATRGQSGRIHVPSLPVHRYQSCLRDALTSRG